ncbi:unnamed protein product [Ectocarpus sp. 13 AM-2016]
MAANAYSGTPPWRISRVETAMPSLSRSRRRTSMMSHAFENLPSCCRCGPNGVMQSRRAARSHSNRIDAPSARPSRQGVPRTLWSLQCGGDCWRQLWGGGRYCREAWCCRHVQCLPQSVLLRRSKESWCGWDRRPTRSQGMLYTSMQGCFSREWHAGAMGGNSIQL